MYKTGLFVVATLACCPWSEAADLAPGQRASGYEYEYSGTPPAGDVIASRSQPFEASVVVEDVRYFQQGALSQQVIRESGTGQLAFLYTITPGNSNATADLISLGATGFGGWSTNVFTDVDLPDVERTADGGTISAFGDEGPRANLLVRTDALAFVDGAAGTVVLRFQGNPGGTPDQTATFATYRPVPEPAALSLLVPAGALVLSRRRRG